MCCTNVGGSRPKDDMGHGPDFGERLAWRCPQQGKALLWTLRQMNLPGNGDKTITKLGETLTGVSINKPLIRKKEAERSRSSSTGGEYQWDVHICMQAQLSGEGLGLTGASPMALAHPSIPILPWCRACPLFDCAVNPVCNLPSFQGFL